MCSEATQAGTTLRILAIVYVHSLYPHELQYIPLRHIPQLIYIPLHHIPNDLHSITSIYHM